MERRSIHSPRIFRVSSALLPTALAIPEHANARKLCLRLAKEPCRLQSTRPNAIHATLALTRDARLNAPRDGRDRVARAAAATPRARMNPRTENARLSSNGESMLNYFDRARGLPRTRRIPASRERSQIDKVEGELKFTRDVCQIYRIFHFFSRRFKCRIFF